MIFRAVGLSLALLVGLCALVPLTTQNTEAVAVKPRKIKKYKKYSKAWWRAYKSRVRKQKSLDARKRQLRLRQIRLANAAKAPKPKIETLPATTEAVTRISAETVVDEAPAIQINDLFMLVQGKINKVIDGDTFAIETKDGKSLTVRMLGIDAPGAGDDFGSRAQKTLSDLLLGKEATVIIRKKDSAERFVGTVYHGGEDINLKQLETGMARYFRQTGYEPKGDDRRLYEQAEQTARAQQKGLWGKSKPNLALGLKK